MKKILILLAIILPILSINNCYAARNRKYACPHRCGTADKTPFNLANHIVNKHEGMLLNETTPRTDAKEVNQALSEQNYTLGRNSDEQKAVAGAAVSKANKGKNNQTRKETKNFNSSSAGGRDILN